MSIHRFLPRVFFLAFVVFLAAGCSNDESYVKDAEKSLILKGLKELKGEYIWKDDLNRFIYSEKSAIEEIMSLGGNTELVIETLVNCLDELAPSSSTIKGEKVALGAICYEALSQTAYYESTNEEGDLKRSWPGHILPTATPAELQEAKRAWKDVVDSKSYTLY